MNINFARIFLEGNFCDKSNFTILEKLNNIEGIKNITLYPNEYLLVFNYHKLNHLSQVLNELSSLGYHQKG